MEAWVAVFPSEGKTLPFPVAAEPLKADEIADKSGSFKEILHYGSLPAINHCIAKTTRKTVQRHWKGENTP